MRVSFVTTNPIKHKSLVRVLEGYGIGIDILDREVQEIQGDSAQEVASAKVREAFRLVSGPVLVNDFAIHFEALDGFPGPFVKQATRQLGLEGYFRLLRSCGEWLSLRCTLVTVLSYLDARLGAPKLFERVTHGAISSDAYCRLPKKPKEKELVMDIFVPEGETLSLAQMPPEQFERWRKRPAHEQVYHDLASFLEVSCR